MQPFDGKRVLLGVTGGIAAYKACQLLRDIRRLGADVRVVMTAAARQFVTPLTFEALSAHPVHSEMFSGESGGALRHVELAAESDLLVICPATADFLGKVAGGLADDLLSALVMVAGPEKTLFCPAMNARMWENPVVQRNVARLRELGYAFVDPEEGQLASDVEGWGVGRLADLGRILFHVKKGLVEEKTFAGKRIIVSAGPTQEPLDPVRYITNASSGKMGFALAEAGMLLGADVILVTGPVDLTPPDGATVERVRTAREMLQAIQKWYDRSDAVIMAAAVADFYPETYQKEKIKKGPDSLTLRLKKNPDILRELAKKKGNRVLVGFAVETENEIANASQKMTEKDLDMIVVNNPRIEGAGFFTDTNVVTILTRDGQEIALPRMSKFEVAWHIYDHLAVQMGLKPAPFRDVIEV